MNQFVLDSVVPHSAVIFLRFDENRTPYLQGARCSSCKVVAPGEREVCNACGARRGMVSVRLGNRGKLYSYTIVHRSFPGVKTPFVAAVVDLEGGGAIQGTLLDVGTDPAKIPFDMPVNLVFRDSGQVAADGLPFLSYYFTPAAELR